MILILAILSILRNNRLGMPVEEYSDRNLNAFCSRETPQVIICENDEDTFGGYRAYSRAEFFDGKMVYLSYTMNKDAKVVKILAEKITKEFGPPIATADLLPGSFENSWEDLDLMYRSASENQLGHPVIRVTLKKEIK